MSGIGSGKRVLVFGVFDRLHPGHEYFLKEARGLGDVLVAVVARDRVVQHLKGRTPVLSEEERADMLRRSGLADMVVLGDEVLGTWSALEDAQPDVIALGYDQAELREAVEKHFYGKDVFPEIRVIGSYDPDTYHSSLL